MKTAVIAVAVAAVSAGVAQADFVVSFPGAYSFTGSQGLSVTTCGLEGSLQGIRVSFCYDNASGSSEAYDVAFTVNGSQWGGYLPFINGAEWGECPTGAPSAADAIDYHSGNLGMGYGVLYSGQSAVVGFGNANVGGGCTLSNVQVTLLGVVPAPGAGAALAVCGALGARRRRR